MCRNLPLFTIIPSLLLLYYFFPLFPSSLGGGDKRTLVAAASAILDTASIIIDDDDIAGGKTFGTESDGEDKRAISGSRLLHPLPEQSFSERHMIGCVISMGGLATRHEICEEASLLTPSFPAFSTLLHESHVVMLT